MFSLLLLILKAVHSDGGARGGGVAVQAAVSDEEQEESVSGEEQEKPVSDPAHPIVPVLDEEREEVREREEVHDSTKKAWLDADAQLIASLSIDELFDDEMTDEFLRNLHGDEEGDGVRSTDEVICVS